MTESTETSSNNINLVRVVPKFTVPESVAPVRPKELPTTIPEASTEPPIETFDNKHGHPYLVEKYGISGLYRNMGLENSVEAIDAYVLAKIASDSLQSTKQSYEAIVDKLESQLNIDPNLDFAKRIEKIASWVAILKEEQRINKLKKEFNASTGK